MKEVYDFIVLPPDGFHMTMRDRIADARHYIDDVLEVVERVRRPADKVLVKYRTGNQKTIFPTAEESRVGYGKLLDLCSPSTVVIGRPGSATWECLLNDISFYTFWDFPRFQGNRFTDKEAVDRLSRLIYIAGHPDELLANLQHQKIFRPGRSKADLIHDDGEYLAAIVATILNRQQK